ncbi:E8/E2 protein [Human papillomavirus type 220]|uniref:Protein E8^E2C n=1 Tax=Human papillomavirus type 220 TaxID=2200957 RepID=A0A2S1ZRW2_9PAPI|nr:E8/E2 protein [Human papillomavirus type 220]
MKLQILLHSSRHSPAASPLASGRTPEHTASTEEDHPTRRIQEQEVAPTTSPTTRRRRGGEQGEPSPLSKRRRPGSAGRSTAPAPEDVGRRHRTVERTGLSRIRRLQEEARDPLVALIKGPANPLKCWRNRCNQKHSSLYLSMSTVWYWVGDNSDKLQRGRILVAFKNKTQRDMFVKLVHLPRGTTLAFGNLDSL